MNRHTPLRDSRPLTQIATDLEQPVRRASTRRRWVGLLAVLALVTTSAVLAYPPDPWGYYPNYAWQAIDPSKTISVTGSVARTCHEFSRGSVCAEFRSWESGTVAGMCCIDPSHLGSSDPEICIVGATYSRDTEPDE